MNQSEQQLLYMRDIIKRQTNYDNDTASEKLIEHNHDVLKVIREYMGIKKEETPPIKSVNQQTFTEIRHLMDDAATRYRMQKEAEERRQALIELAMSQQQQSSQNLRKKLDIIKE